MKASHNKHASFFHQVNLIVGAACIIAALLLSSHRSNADIPDPSPRFHLSGMYLVSESSDPMFPMHENREWFLDFGQGTTAGASSGTVAVSLRENPNVQVRIMVWQYFPEQGTLAIGNQTGRASNRAVTRGIWSIGADSQHVVLRRQNANVVLRRTGSNAY